MTDTIISALQARIDDITWDIEHLTALAEERSDRGHTRGNIDAVARSEVLWDERDDLRAELLSLQSKAA